jgi:ribosomal-protein-alanine N-acetyltransferase
MELDCGKCKIRSWRLEDGQSLVCHANNLKVWRNLRDRFPHPYTPDEAQKWLAQTVSADPEVDFSVVFGGEAVGGIGFTLGSDVERHSAEVGYWLGEGFWGRGIATAAVHAATRWAFGKFSLRRVYAVPFSDNIGSIRVLEKVGFVREGVMRCAAVKDGQVKDQILYALVTVQCR